MLVLSRNEGQKIQVGEIILTVLEIRPAPRGSDKPRVKLGFEGPREIRVKRVDRDQQGDRQTQVHDAEVQG